MDLTVKPVETQKDHLNQPKLAKLGVIPKINSSIILCGRSGSGKSTLLHNLLTDERFYDANKTFDLIFLISPTGEADDIQKALNIPRDQVFTDLQNEALPALKKIHDHQEKSIRDLGAQRAKKICVLFDDCVADTKFVKHPLFVRSFILSRHLNCMSILCTQHWTAVPRVCRIQANYCAFFALSNSEIDLLCDEFCAPGMDRKEFYHMVHDTVKEPYSFLGIDMKSPWDKRFRKNLGEFINLGYYKKKSSFK